jgi:hypothetical protein
MILCSFYYVLLIVLGIVVVTMIHTLVGVTVVVDASFQSLLGPLAGASALFQICFEVPLFGLWRGAGSGAGGPRATAAEEVQVDGVVLRDFALAEALVVLKNFTPVHEHLQQDRVTAPLEHERFDVQNRGHVGPTVHEARFARWALDADGGGWEQSGVWGLDKFIPIVKVTME